MGLNFKFEIGCLSYGMGLVLGEREGHRLFGKLNKRIEKLFREASDDFLDTLLVFMDVAFNKDIPLEIISPGLKGFERNIEGFEGRYLFMSELDKGLSGAAIFRDNDMSVMKHVKEKDHIIENWDIIIKFRSAEAFRNFLFSSDQDILKLILTNEVEVEGNLNHLFKFGFISKDLLRRTGLGRLLQ